MPFNRPRVILFSLILILFLSSLPGLTQTIPVIAGRNVNMVRDDPYLQRQNEPSLAVSSLNPRHLLAGANDYYLINGAGNMTEEVTTDAWLGVYRSYDGGQSWKSELLEGYSKSHKSPLAGFDAAADPTVRAGLNGWFYYSGIAFDRKRKGRSVIFVARFKDNGSKINFVDTKIIDEGTSGQFSDKPWIVTDKDNRIYVVYSIFLGEIDKNIHSKIMIARSMNGGDSWDKPSKLSESQQKNQGTTVAVDQNDGILYVAWRRFKSTNVTDAILIAKSDDYGNSFKKAEEVATIEYSFDQPTMGGEGFSSSQFRTNSYPAIAVDNFSRIYLAWTQRASLGGDTRIVFTSKDGTNWGSSWTPIKRVEPNLNGPCHQVMPTMVYGAGKLMIAWYDTRFSARRYDEFGNLRTNAPGAFEWIRDGATLYRETVDVRLAHANPSASPVFNNSIQVSRYLWVLEDHPGQSGKYRLRQGQFNPPNYKMFSGGTVPFHGDYLDIAYSPDDPFTFYVSWTDNRDVSPPKFDYLWNTYIAPQPFTPGPGKDCTIDPNAVLVGMRNQNIYCSKITQGVEVGSLNNNRAPGDTSFVIFVNNLLNPPDPTNPYASVTFYLTIHDSSGIASFRPLTENRETLISVSVPYYSSIVRQIFVSGGAGHTVRVNVTATSPQFSDDIFLNLKAGGIPGGTASLVLDGTTKIDWNDSQLISKLNPNLTNITNPNITNPNITNPNIMNPNITNPNITNPNITNPNITNPNITNPNITNPNITNPNITNIPPTGTKIADKVWSVHNEGTSVAAYTFKGIAGDTLPQDQYIYSQLMIYQVHYTHSTNGCYLMTEAHHELLVNVISPFLTTNTTTLDIDKFLADPEAFNSDINNATFSLAPGEHAVLLLRVIDTNPNRSLVATGTRTLFTPTSYADDVASVVVSHTSTESNPVGSASVMILPDSLPTGTYAGQTYPKRILRAIGGFLNPGPYYTWTYMSGSIPDGMTLIGNVLSGIPIRIGSFSFTVKVTDDFVDPNPANPDKSHFDTHTFYGEILASVPELSISMTPGTNHNSGVEGQSYDRVTFKTTGGIPPYIWTLTGAPSSLSLQPTTNPGEMKLTGTLQAGEWNIHVKVEDSRLPKDATKFAEAGFQLCVAPLALQINLPALVDREWLLGTSHSIQISAGNVKNLPPTWTVKDLPPNFSVNSLIGSPIEITGLPVFDPTKDYPATYPVTVQVADDFYWCDPSTGSKLGPRILGKTFNIVINPKEPEWDKKEANNGKTTAVTAAPDGSVYVTGYTGAEGSRDYLTVMYDSEGTRQWIKTYNGPANGDDVPKAIAADATGVYVTGFSQGTTSGRDIYTIKYNPNGSMAWDARYDGPSHMGDEANAIALDNAHVYVAGFVHRGNITSHKDYTVIKYNKVDSSEVWDVRYDSRRNGMDEATAIAVFQQDVYVTGKSQESSNTGEPKSFDYLTVKYNSSGRLQWEVRDDGLSFGDDEPTAIAVDGSGYVYVTGQECDGSVDTDFYTVKYNSSGQNVWGNKGKSYGGIGADRAVAIVFDDDGHVYVTGKLKGTNGFYDYATIRYNSNNGTQEWDDVYTGGKGDDIPVGLAYGMENGTGFVFVAGFKTTADQGKDFFCIKYKSLDKTIAWIAQYNSGASADDEATAMFINATDLYVTGFNGQGIVTVKYSK